MFFFLQKRYAKFTFVSKTILSSEHRSSKFCPIQLTGGLFLKKICWLEVSSYGEEKSKNATVTTPTVVQVNTKTLFERHQPAASAQKIMHPCATATPMLPGSLRRIMEKKACPGRARPESLHHLQRPTRTEMRNKSVGVCCVAVRQAVRAMLSRYSRGGQTVISGLSERSNVFVD